MRARRLIVNADDLGRTVGINDGIFASHRDGIVTSATLMVGYPAARDAASRLAEHPALGVGLHVQLSGGRPLLDPERIPSLVDADGNLPRRPTGLGDVRAAEVAAEIRTQLARFVTLVGRLPTHLDSHHHSHCVPVVRDVLVELATEHGLPVRNASPEVAAALRARGVATTTVFDDRFYDAGVTLEVLLAAISGVGEGTTELMCHPGRSDDELREGSTYAGVRDQEIRLLCAPEARAAITEHGIELIHFGAL
ncbi:MAG TPA: carbohydrate deacetylase [Thermoanaerobaculia bacterium]|nr:carbohydrate deacetylase [Thermoanaerobaculia bacterium]